MIEKSVSSERGRTYYWASKGASPLTLVFLPGLTANHHLFDGQIGAFAERYGVIVWDAPAHGKSRPYRDFSYDHAAEELKRILDQEGAAHAVLVGQSGGGFVSQSFYKKYPETVEGMLIIGSCPYDPSYYSRSDLFWLRQTKWMFYPYPDRVLRDLMAKMCGRTQHARENMLAMLEDYPKKELCKLMYIGLADFIPEICEMRIRCPVWLLVGEYDRTGKVMAYNKMWHEKEGHPLYIIADAAHNANDDQPEQVNELLNAFLQAL